MNASFRVITDGIVYIDNDRIAAVLPAGATAPPDFASVEVTTTDGSIYPGLIELHNHLPYNIIGLWDVAELYTNRGGGTGGWDGSADKARLLHTPVLAVGSIPALVPSLARYVEGKCLVAGVTTSQGVTLANGRVGRAAFAGAVRNVESPGDSALPAAATHVPDILPNNARPFLRDTLAHHQCVLLHLAEGTDATAHGAFEALRIDSDTWAINAALAGIHCTALTPADFAVLASHHASMVWSPFSNLLLYGATANVKAARAAGVPIALGSDWSFTGSKNVLGELKVAQIYSAHTGGLFSDRELVAMVTRDAARILHWDALLGSIEVGKYADLIVVDGQAEDPYGVLIGATEATLQLVLIGGRARYGDTSLVTRLGPVTERLTIAQRERALNLTDTPANPIPSVTLGAARAALRTALRDVPALMMRAKRHAMRAARAEAAGVTEQPWVVAFDDMMLPEATYSTLSVPSDSGTVSAQAVMRALPLAMPTAKAARLDPLATVADARFLDLAAHERNLPAYLGRELSRAYGG